MSVGQLAALALAAIVVFWMVGAYNRLVGMRNAIGVAWSQVDELLKRRGVAIEPALAALRGPLAQEHGALDALLTAQARVAAAADALRARPLVPPLAAALAAAEAALGPAATRVLALTDGQPALLADAAIGPALQLLRDTGPRLEIARQAFNEAVLAYNQSVDQVPTCWLARLFGFAAAGAL